MLTVIYEHTDVCVATSRRLLDPSPKDCILEKSVCSTSRGEF